MSRVAEGTTPSGTSPFGLTRWSRGVLCGAGLALFGLAAFAIARMALGLAPPTPSARELPLVVHLATIVPAIPLGAYLIWARKGGPRHKALGKLWISLMTVSAVSTLFLRQINVLAERGGDAVGTDVREGVRVLVRQVEEVLAGPRRSPSSRGEVLRPHAPRWVPDACSRGTLPVSSDAARTPRRGTPPEPCHRPGEPVALGGDQGAATSAAAGTIVTLSPQPQASVWLGFSNTKRLDSFSVT